MIPLGNQPNPDEYFTVIKFFIAQGYTETLRQNCLHTSFMFCKSNN